MHDVEVGRKLFGRFIGRRLPGLLLRRRHLGKPRCRRGEPSLDEGDGAPIGLVRPEGRLVRGAKGKIAQPIGDRDQPAVERQLGAEQAQFLEVEAEGAAALHDKGAAQHVGGDEGIAVAVAANPAADAQK